MIFWEEDALNDRESIFEFLYDYNSAVAEKTDDIIVSRAEKLAKHPEIGVVRAGLKGRLLIVPEVSLIIHYTIFNSTLNSDIYILRILHQKQKFPT